MATNAEIESAKTILATATSAQKQEIASAAGLAQPKSDSSLTVIWVTVLLLLGGLAFFTLWLSYERSVDEKSLAPFSEIAALAVGAIAGLLAPSPINS